MYSENGNLIFEELITNSIIRYRDGNIVFFHPSFQEFFAAKEIIKRCRTENINDVFKDIINNERWEEVFVFCSGLFEDLDEQSRFFDLILKKDLELFYRCITSKNDLSDILNKLDDTNLAKYYLETILNTYISVIDIHFNNIKNQFNPYVYYFLINHDKCLDIDGLKIGIIGNYYIEGHLEYGMRVISGCEERVVIGDIPKLGINGVNQAHFINTYFSGYSLHSAREIALKEINNQLKKIFEMKNLKENAILLKERFDYYYQYLKKYHFFQKLDDTMSHGEMISILREKEAINPNIYYALDSYNNFRKHSLSIDEIISIVGILEHNKIPLNVSILPQPDALPLDRPTNFIVDLYTDNTLKIYVESFFKHLMISFKEICESNFPTLCYKFPLLSQYPIKCICEVNRKWCNRDWREIGSIKYIYVPVESASEAYKVDIYMNEKRIDFGEEMKNNLEKLKRMNRLVKNYNIYYSSTIITEIVTTTTGILGKKVYEKIKEDLEQLIGRF